MSNKQCIYIIVYVLLLFGCSDNFDYQLNIEQNFVNNSIDRKKLEDYLKRKGIKSDMYVFKNNTLYSNDLEVKKIINTIKNYNKNKYYSNEYNTPIYYSIITVKSNNKLIKCITQNPYLIKKDFVWNDDVIIIDNLNILNNLENKIFTIDLEKIVEKPYYGLNSKAFMASYLSETGELLNYEKPFYYDNTYYEEIAYIIYYAISIGYSVYSNPISHELNFQF